ncbi:MAG TPA: cysteine hydrolase family protein [Candidatus Eremiobacteraceae bacterium]
MKGPTALLVIDVQTGIYDTHPPWDGWPQVLERICDLVGRARTANAPVIYVQHDGEIGDRLQAGTAGWELHPALDRTAATAVVRKTASDAFYQTTLLDELEKHDIKSLVVAGCMTQFCVESTCRRAVSLGFDVALVGDAHATADSGLLDAAQIIGHHNRTLDGLSAGKAEISVMPCEAISFG